MLGTVEQDKLRELSAEIERLEDGMARIKATLASLDYAAPEVREQRVHSLINVCRQVTK